MRWSATAGSRARSNRASGNFRPFCTKPKKPPPIIELIEFMPANVRIPTPLRKLTNNEELVVIQAGDISAAIEELQTRYPGIQERLVDESGAVRRFVNVYVNEEDIRFLQNLQTPIKDGDEVSIIPAIAGG